MKSSLLRLFAIATLITALMAAVSSCGTQKFGCPGSISKVEQTTPDHS